MAESSFLIGQTVLHYRIAEKIGTGGMGEVYRATDTKLSRDVALKVLPPNMARDPDRLARFQREARAVAALNNPHIVTIYSVEEGGGVHFLTMELVEGQSLDHLIPASGLSVEQVVEIASALADALAAAHEKGIVHRDLKPANVMVTTDGRVKVLDFGLAKDVSGGETGGATLSAAGLTQAGVVMGTPAYMSPEQIAGREVDHRTDIFSLGVVLHEMVTGRRPFEGTSLAELASAVLRDTPVSIGDVRADLPSDLVRITRRCLEKDPRHRVQTARDVSNEFRDLARETPQKVSSLTPPASRAVAASDSGTSRTEEGFWVAVLPFKYTGGNADLTALAEGLTEDIVTGLSRFSYLKVIARSATSRYTNDAIDVHSAAKELGARYVMEGTLRQAGSKLRIVVQLVDATTGAHLWAETYVHPFNSEALFELQDELVPRIVSTVADTRGVLPHTMSEALRNRASDQLTPYEALLRSFAYFQRINAEEHGIVRAALERAVKQAPGFADAWAVLSIIYREEYTHVFNPLPDPLGRAFEAARRATDAAPSNHYAYHALASVLFFRRESQGFRNAAQRAISLNSMDGFTFAYMGLLFAYSGDWEHGCTLAEKARNLNPHFPGWYWFPSLFDAYRKGDYRGALDVALKVNMPGFWRTQFALAATYGQLGELELARSAVRELLAIRPDFAVVAHEELAKWWQPELIAHLIDGLRKAGLDVPPKKNSGTATLESVRSSSSISARDSGSVRSDEGFWVALLPVKCAGASTELKALADGLSEEIVAGLARFSYLRVITSGSTQHYADQSPDLRVVGKDLGARYVMSASLRQTGSEVRVAVQLVDAATGAQLWAETYKRPFNAEAVFELQDDLVPRIVSTIADAYGVLPHTMSQEVRSKAAGQLTAYEALLRSFSYAERVTAEEHAQAKAALELALQKTPASSDCWAMLSILLTDGHIHGFSGPPDPLGRALQAARRAVDTNSSNHKAYQALAWALFFRKEFPASRIAAERTIALNPLDACAAVYMGFTIAFSGEWERGCKLVVKSIELNPNHPGWYWFAPFLDTYRRNDYPAALGLAMKINMPGFTLGSVALAAAYGQLGEKESGRSTVNELLALKPEYASIARTELGKLVDPDLVEHLIDGLRKAGLEIAPEKGAGVAALDSRRPSAGSF
jgi:TolB-like protein